MRSLFGSLASAVRNQAPVPYSGRAAYGLPVPLTTGGAGPEQQMRAMGSVGTLFAIVDRIATSTAAVDWTLYRAAKPGQDPDEREPVTAHLAADLWNRPNPFFTSSLLVETIQQHFELVGESWLLVSRNPAARSIPLELWPVRPDRMLPIPDRDDYLTGYMYLSPDGQRIPLALDEVLHLRRPNPIDPYRGIGAVQTILADLQGVSLSAEWNRNFFLNSAEPGGIIEFPDGIGDEEFDEFTDRWREAHQGVANAHRVAVIERGKWVNRSFSQRDMQFAELRSVSREVIREAFGISGFELGLVDDVNRATAEASALLFAQRITVPRLERLRDALNTQFLPLFGATGKGVEFDFASPVPGDREADDRERKNKAESYKLLIEAGVDPDDAAEVAGLPPMRTAPKPEPPAAPPPPAPAPEPEEQPTGRHVHRIRNADDPELPDLEPVQASWERALDNLLSRWASVLRDWIRAILAKLRDLLDDDDITGLADLAKAVPTDDAVEILTGVIVDLAEQAAGQVVAEAADQDVTIEPGEVPVTTLATIATVTTELLASEFGTSAAREALRVWRPGVSPAEVVDDVQTHLEQLTDARPRLWLGTALTTAQHEGRTATFQAAEDAGGGREGGEGEGHGDGLSLPSPAYYAQEILDKNTCKWCREVDQRWLGNTIAEARREYPAGGYVRCAGGPRCRGMVVAVWRGGSDRSKWIEKEPVDR